MSVPRGDEPHHVALHHRFAAALLGFGDVLDLLADRDAMAERDQLLEIILRGVDGHAAERNVVALIFAAPGEHDAERGGGDLGVLEEHLVEIAHAVEQQVAGVERLQLEILPHGWRRGGEDGLDRCGVVFGLEGGGFHGVRKVGEKQARKGNGSRCRIHGWCLGKGPHPAVGHPFSPAPPPLGRRAKSQCSCVSLLLRGEKRCPKGG